MTSPAVPVINIWIHGTFPQDFITHESHNKALLEYIVNLYYCPPGLNKVIDLPEKYHYCKLMRTANAANAGLFPLEHLYLFGWSGKLDPQDRDSAGKLLYHALTDLMKTTYSDTQPFIRIMGHSHGGNVALAAAKAAQEKPVFFINELLMLATPVHTATADCTTSPLFQNIFSIHSHVDMIQVLDPQGWPMLSESLKKALSSFDAGHIKEMFSAFQQEPFFSERHFKPQEHLKNVRLKFNGRDVFHMEYIFFSFARRLPIIVDAIQQKPGAPTLVLNKDGDWVLDVRKTNSSSLGQ
jgi:hypothetical protein